MNQKSIEIYGNREDIREMTDRLVRMLPGTANLTEKEALTVAQVAIAHGLDPFTGEVWGLKSDKGVWYGVMVGIAGRRKLARKQADEEGGTYWTEPPRLVSPELYSAPPEAVVYEVILRDTVSTQAYAKSVHSLTTAGIPYKDAIAMMGDAPRWVGVGIAEPKEFSKMPIHARAKKRAEADALKQRYDIRLQGVEFYDETNRPDDAMMPEFQDTIDAEVTEVQEPKRSEAEILKDLGYEPDPYPSPQQIAAYRQLLKEGHAAGLVEDPSVAMPADEKTYHALCQDLRDALKEVNKDKQGKLI